MSTTAHKGSPAAIFHRAMGVLFGKLHPALQAFHSAQGEHLFAGNVKIVLSSSPGARILARFLGLPRAAAEQSFSFQLNSTPSVEKWTRHFPHKTMHSLMSFKDGFIVERLGPVKVVFELLEKEQCLVLRLKRMKFLGIPFPRWFLPRIEAWEKGEGHTLFFNVKADVPLVGTVAHYQGWLDVSSVMKSASRHVAKK